MTAQWANVRHNVAPMRAKPDHGSEQISQAIMGEAVEIVEIQAEFAKVRGLDGYEGWVSLRHLELCEARDLYVSPDSGAMFYYISSPFADLISDSGALMTRLVYGTPIRMDVTTDADCELIPVRLPGGVDGFVRFESLIYGDATPEARARICPTALTFLGTPYLWGGSTPFGFDCSGLVQRAYSATGIILPRDAYQQAVSPLGEHVPIGAELAACDLVFFRGPRDPMDRGITHVGMMIDSKQMIHASGRSGVVVQDITDGEILAAYTYRGAWRLV